jgi:von Willebrand factor type A domain
VVFVVDKSGSMGEGSGGVDRFRLAQRAVLETARGLSERDSLGLVVFDVEPRVLIPLAPTRAGTHALAKDWQASPRGGTQLAPAIAAGIAELERAGAGRRLLVVVTDGYIDSAPLMALRARLDRSRIETIALAVGPDADVSALQGFIGSDAGVVLRVNETAELPRVMRSNVEQRRARIERGKITVKQQHPMPFAPVTLKDWPGISAYAVTRSRPQASVPLQSERGDPLLAIQTAGLGRVVTVTSGLGTWTPQWLQWTQWPQLAGGLTDWISGTTNDGTLALSVSDLPDRLQIDVDVRSSNGWSAPEQMSIAMTAPAGEARVVPSAHVAPGRLRMSLPDEGPGVYTFIASSSLGTQKLLHLRRHRAEDEAWGTSPALEAWKNARLINNWDPAILQRPTGTRVERQIDRWLIGLALVLFLAGVIVDRLKFMR